MRKSLAVAVFAASLFARGVSAAPIGPVFDLFIYQSPSDPLTWSFSLRAELPVAALGITVPEGTAFTIDPLNTAIAPFGSGSSLSPAATEGRWSLNLNPTTCVGINCVPFVGANDWKSIGTFHFPNPDYYLYPYLQPDDDSVGGTLFDAQLVPYAVGPAECISIIGGMSCAVGGFVPEPSLLPLLAAAALALHLTRRG